MNLSTHLKTRRSNHSSTLRRTLRCYKNIRSGESRHKVVPWSQLETVTQWELILHNTISKVLTIENSVTDYKVDIQQRDHQNHRHLRHLKILVTGKSAKMRQVILSFQVQWQKRRLHGSSRQTIRVLWFSIKREHRLARASMQILPRLQADMKLSSSQSLRRLTKHSGISSTPFSDHTKLRMAK